ncbi:MAG: spore photoproduct lyase family protein [Verrucomicrobiota bacterium]
MSQAAKHFSRIYVERGANAYPFAQQILQRFPTAQRVDIEDYRDVFNRPGQDFQRQKQSKALILARKKQDFLYPANEYVQGRDVANFHYTTLQLNCLYNCAYCFLQGMYTSANLVAFVNLEDYFEAAERALSQRSNPSKPLELAISYESDLLASERILPYCREWIEFARQQPDLVIEMRTKSGNWAALQDLEPHPRAVLAWTLSPQEIIERYEQDTAPVNQRLKALSLASQAGWPVRLCFDPVLPNANWRSSYRELFTETFARIPPNNVVDVSLGVFRLNTEYFNRLKKNRPDTDLAYRFYHRENGVVTHPHNEREMLIDFARTELTRFIPADKLQIWT